MDIPNILTVIRSVLAIVIMYLLISMPVANSIIFAFILFSVGVATDYLDGLFARRRNAGSNFGKIMDPIADKLLILLTLFAFSYLGVVKLAMVALIAGREIIISAVRIFFLIKGKVLAAKEVGKYKTFCQMTAVVYIFIIVVIFKEIKNQPIPYFHKVIIDIIILILVVITLYTGFIYLKNLRFKDER